MEGIKEVRWKRWRRRGRKGRMGIIKGKWEEGKYIRKKEKEIFREK